MSAKEFKFISPGVFINEIDNSQLLEAPGGTGPAIIGRAQQGPGLIPTTVTSFSDFVEKFGNPVAGNTNDDVSRKGNSVGPTYGAYAAQAWLRNNSPITYVRLVGREATGATTAGVAGWATTNENPDVGTTAGGAYGLFVMESGSAHENRNVAKLAAVFYLNSGSIGLSGTAVSCSADGKWEDTSISPDRISTNAFIRATAAGQFKLVIKSDASVAVASKFDFSPSSENFIRKVFNTNPTLTNSTITDSTTAAYEGYWLGPSFEDEIRLNILTGTAATNQYGAIVPLYNNSISAANFERDFADAKTGYFFSQDLSTATASYTPSKMQKLFRLVGKNTGRWAARNIKVSIANIKAPVDDVDQYGTFSVQIRDMNDTDNRPKYLEQFSNCNLNPSSENYVARKIGNKFLEWDDTDRRYREYGDFNSQSDYIYVDMVDAVHEGKTNPEYLPFGVIGPPIFKEFEPYASPTSRNIVTGGLNYYEPPSTDTLPASQYWADTGFLISGSHETTAASGFEFKFAALRLRNSASEGNPTNPRAVYFGVDTTFKGDGRPGKSAGDYTGPMPGTVGLYEAQSSNPQTSASFVFTLDDMCNTSANAANLSGTNVYVSGSRALDLADGTGVRAGLLYINSGSYNQVLDNGADSFTTVLHGGYDGMNVTEAEPFRNTLLSGKSNTTSYAFNSVQCAIDSLRDPENVEFDLVAYPGCTNNVINRNLISMAEDRADAMAIVDLQGGFVPDTENTDTVQTRLGSVSTTLTNKKNNLAVNSSFGAAYYPWVQIQDTINNALLWVPPSVAALGALSYGQATQELWFAPAGFTRGGLSQGAGGVPVVGVRQRLIAKERDQLYEANVNPIAQFPAEGIVIFGQKTLQMTPSALDRINVRRLLIFLKRQISKIAATLLFDQNVESTWNRFTGKVGPLLQGVKAGLGLTDYRLILDTETTTPDLIDRNIMYAKIFLKPARSIEFIAIDFVITDSGAAFED